MVDFFNSTIEEKIEAVEHNFPMNSIAHIWGNYILEKEEAEEHANMNYVHYEDSL